MMICQTEHSSLTSFIVTVSMLSPPEDSTVRLLFPFFPLDMSNHSPESNNVGMFSL